MIQYLPCNVIKWSIFTYPLTLALDLVCFLCFLLFSIIDTSHLQVTVCMQYPDAFFLLFSIRWENCYRCCRLKWQYYTLYCYYDDRMCANQRWIKDRRRCEAHLCTLRWQRAEETSWSELIWAIWYWLLIWTHIYCNTCYLGSQIRSLVNRLQGNQSIPR